MNLTRTSLPAALVLLAACVTEEDDVIAPIGVAMEGSTPVGLEVLPYTGNAPVTTIARTVNAWGAAVPSAPEEIVVGGSVESLSIDGLGYGRITVEQVGVTEILGGEAPAEVVALSGSWPGFGVQRGEVPLGDAVFAASAPSGVALASASEVWWVGADMPAHRVLQWPEGELISGMRSGNADSDGLPDLVVWGGSTVIMLRGRPGGGFAWGGGWQSPGNAAVGASLGDANLDSAEDIAVVWAIANGDSMMEILTGDGIGGFSGIPVPLSDCLLYTSPSPRDQRGSRMPSSA